MLRTREPDLMERQIFFRWIQHTLQKHKCCGLYWWGKKILTEARVPRSLRIMKRCFRITVWSSCKDRNLSMPLILNNGVLGLPEWIAPLVLNISWAIFMELRTRIFWPKTFKNIISPEKLKHDKDENKNNSHGIIRLDRICETNQNMWATPYR